MPTAGSWMITPMARSAGGQETAETVQIPVQNARQPQLREFVQFEPQRPGRQADLSAMRTRSINVAPFSEMPNRRRKPDRSTR